MKLFLAGVILTTMMVTGCADEGIEGVKVGMTAAELKSAKGTPTFTRKIKSGEIWTYGKLPKPGEQATPEDVDLIVIRDGKVAEYGGLNDFDAM